MSLFSEKYSYPCTPLASRDAIVRGEKWRFTVLTDSLIRIEYDEEGIFEDRATQNVVNRQFPVPEFGVNENEESIVIETEKLTLKYFKNLPFNEQSIRITSKELNGYNGLFFVTWDDRLLPNESINTNDVMKNLKNMSDISGNTLKGTLSRLDNLKGECPLSEGIVSRNYSVLNDAGSMIIREDGFVEKRRKEIDRYIFMYMDDYLGALKAFCMLTGKTPMIPRYALGNWWSKYHKYSQEEYIHLLNTFDEKNLPFSMAVLDMDWHKTKMPPKNGSGWGGYTWNKELFPDHKAFLSEIHKRGYHIALNVHPGTGVTPVDDAYETMAKVQNIDTGNRDTIPIDLSKPEFLEKFFDVLYHPNEEDGVDFWWVDGFAKNLSSNYGLDYLWMSSHYYYLDNCRNNKRGLSFNRCTAGAASHRYPIGFSGDAFSTWEMLDFQPYFTLTASNVSFGWWSHDIGGFRDGIRDSELYTRWVQFGVFSPITRLHCNQSKFNSREPWNYDLLTENIVSDFLRLRHKMIPYTYTMNYISYAEDVSMLRPLYYYHSKCKEAYRFKNVYYFGSEMIAAPITKPADRVTLLGASSAWLPAGEWYDFFTGEKYTGDITRKYYRNRNCFPLFVKAGGIVPFDASNTYNSVDNPKVLEVQVFPGANNTFVLYEDDGITQNYKKGDCVKTAFELEWNENPKFIIQSPEGNLNLLPNERSYRLVFKCFALTRVLKVLVNGEPIDCPTEISGNDLIITVHEPKGAVEIIFGSYNAVKDDFKKRLYELLYSMNYEIALKDEIYDALSEIPEIINRVHWLENKEGIDENVKYAILEKLG